MKPSTHPAFVFLLAAFHLVAAVQEPPNLPRIPPRTPTANNQRPSQNGMGPRERVIAASLLPWRDPQPLLPRSGCALDESEAIELEKIYQQLRDDFSVAPSGPSRGIELRRAQQRFYERVSNFVQSNPDSAWTQGLQIEMAKDDIQKGAYLKASENLRQVWEATSDAADEPSAGMARLSADLLARNLALCGRFDQLAELESAMTNSPIKTARGLHWARAKEIQRFALQNPQDSSVYESFCNLLSGSSIPTPAGEVERWRA